MSTQLLWRRLTRTDFDAINGKAAPSGTGGGAMHIALGTDSDKLPIIDFLSAGDETSVTVQTEGIGAVPASSLTFDGNPARRGGEWRITDQFSHRHPAWSVAAGFPSEYNESDRPIVLVLNRDGKFYASYSTEDIIRGLAPSLGEAIDSSQTRSSGIVQYQNAWDPIFGIGFDNVAEYEKLVEGSEAPEISKFDPTNVSDGREKILSEIVRRQGQSTFRKKLIKAYQGQCAICSSRVIFTLEAAHITPYLGPKTNHASNGILLRADLHTLFDLGLITVSADELRVLISSSLKKSDYQKFDGSKIFVPKETDSAPSKAALIEHNKCFIK